MHPRYRYPRYPQYPPLDVLLPVVAVPKRRSRLGSTCLMAPELLSKQNPNECREIMCIYIYTVHMYIDMQTPRQWGLQISVLKPRMVTMCHYYYSAKEQKTWPELGQPTLRRSSFPKLVLSTCTWGRPWPSCISKSMKNMFHHVP